MKEKPIPYPDLSPDQKLIIANLSEQDINEIDNLLLSNSSKHWRKQAIVIGKTISKLKDKWPEIPDNYFALRINKLVKDGYLESQGNLRFMRFSEVRLPSPN